MQGNLTPDTKGQQGILLDENERLQAELDQRQDTVEDKDKLLASLESVAIAAGAKFNKNTGTYERGKSLVVLSKGAFASIIIVAIALMGLSLYTFLFKKAPVIDRRPIYTSGKGYLHPPYVLAPYDEKDAIDAITAAEIKRVAAKKKKAADAAATSAEKPKKKKKFLGIF
jgi:hypothetical protein